MSILILFPIILSLLGLGFVLYLFKKLKQKEVEEGKILEISKAIKDGAKTFLLREYQTMGTVFILIVIALGIIQKSWIAPLVFLFGAGISILSSYLSTIISTKVNVKTVSSVKKSLLDGFYSALMGGQMIGFLVVGLGLLGIVLAWGIFAGFKNAELLINYAFGASFVALFMRVGGGIFTKSADMGADLVGKTELGIPEDDPRNPAVIADNVGDNVGNIAGLGTDFFESYVSLIAAAMVIGSMAFVGNQGVMLPLLLAGSGIFASLVGSFFVKISKKANPEKQVKEIQKAMDKGVIIANIVMVISSLLISLLYAKDLKIFWIALITIIGGYFIGKSIEYYTDQEKKPTQDVAIATQTGPAGVIIEGLLNGMKSTAIPIIIFSIIIVISYLFNGMYGIIISGLSFLGVLSINLAFHSYGPIIDNAAGIARMAEETDEVKARTKSLNVINDEMSAPKKGFTIIASAFVSLAWLMTYYQQGSLGRVDLFDAKTIAAIFVAAMFPLLFVALILKATSQGALEIANEVRSQFKDKKGLMEGKEKADYKACIDLATTKALKEMSFPAFLIIAIPIIIGVLLGKEAVAGALIGSLISGLILSLFATNAGSSWDNAKEYIERGNIGGEGSDAHKAIIVGDTIGDPLKDTVGPSLNILIKLIGVVAILALPLFI